MLVVWIVESQSWGTDEDRCVLLKHSCCLSGSMSCRYTGVSLYFFLHLRTFLRFTLIQLSLFPLFSHHSSPHDLPPQSLQSSHKSLHSLIQKMTASNLSSASKIPAHMQGFKWTGSLRPCYPLSAKRDVPDGIGRPDYADHRELDVCAVSKRGGMRRPGSVSVHV